MNKFQKYQKEYLIEANPHTQIYFYNFQKLNQIYKRNYPGSKEIKENKITEPKKNKEKNRKYFFKLSLSFSNISYLYYNHIKIKVYAKT